MEGKKPHKEKVGPSQSRCDFRGERLPAFTPRIETDEILRRLIAEDLRCGRLTAARCRAICRYARDFGLSATQSTRLIVQCRNEALESNDPTERRNARRLSAPFGLAVRPAVKFAILASGLIALEIALLRYFSG